MLTYCVNIESDVSKLSNFAVDFELHNNITSELITTFELTNSGDGKWIVSDFGTKIEPYLDEYGNNLLSYMVTAHWGASDIELNGQIITAGTFKDSLNKYIKGDDNVSL